MDSSNKSDQESLVSYEDSPVAQVEHAGIEYRVDPGRGSAVAISSRDVGSARWTFVTEARFDGLRLKAKALAHPVVSALETALKAAVRAQNEQAWG